MDILVTGTESISSNEKFIFIDNYELMKLLIDERRAFEETVKIDVLTPSGALRNYTRPFDVDCITKDAGSRMGGILRVTGDSCELGTICEDDIVILTKPSLSEKKVKCDLQIGSSIYSFEGKVKIKEYD